MTQSNDKVTTPPGLLPFSWEEAQKRPDAVVARDGRPVRLLDYNPRASESEQVAGWYDDMLVGWHTNGAAYGSASEADLFLKPVLREVFQNAYTGGASDFKYDRIADAQLCQKHTYSDKNTAIAVICFSYQGDTLLDVQIVHRYNQEVSHEN